MRRLIRAMTTAALAVVFTMSLLAINVWAYTVEQGDEPVTDQLAISPLKAEVMLEPGQSTVQEVTIVNRTGATVDASFSTVDFAGSLDPSVSHVLLEDEDSTRGARDWMELEIDKIELEQGDTLKFDVRITAPLDAEPGGYYAAVVAEPGSAAGQDGDRATSLFLITVPGEFDSRATLNEPGLPSLASFGPINIDLVFNNLGNIHQSPSGSVTITNILGQEVAVLPVEEWVVLPESSRRTVVEWPGRWHFGPYKVNAQISYGEDGNILSASSTIWFLPWDIVLAGLAALLIILFLIIIFIRNRRRKRREVEEGFNELQPLGESAPEEVTELEKEELKQPEAVAPGRVVIADAGEIEQPAMSADLVPLNQVLPSTEDPKIVDISDPETRQLVRELIKNEMDLARMYIIEGKTEEARQELLEARSAAMKLKLFTDVTVIDDLLNYL